MKKIVSMLCLMAFVGVYSPVTANINVPANTSVTIAVEQTQTSKTVVSGSTIEARIVDDVIRDNVLVFRKGDRAILNVMTAKKAKFVGVPGEMVISGGKVFDVNGDEHRFDFTKQIVGEEKTWPKVCLGCGLFIILAPVALFGFIKGGQAEIVPTANLDVRTVSPFSFKE